MACRFLTEDEGGDGEHKDAPRCSPQYHNTCPRAPGDTQGCCSDDTLDLLVVKALSISHTSLVSPTCTSPKDVKKAAVLTMLNEHI